MTKKLIKAALKNPKVVWKLLKSKPKILGPWREAKGPGWSQPGAIARFTVDNKYRVTVVKEKKPDPPDITNFYEWGGIDHEAHQEALAKYNANIHEWKPWRYSADSAIEIPIEHRSAYMFGYAATLEEAKQAMDQILIDNGYLLYNGE